MYHLSCLHRLKADDHLLQFPCMLVDPMDCHSKECLVKRTCPAIQGTRHSWHLLQQHLQLITSLFIFRLNLKKPTIGKNLICYTIQLLLTFRVQVLVEGSFTSDEVGATRANSRTLVTQHFYRSWMATCLSPRTWQTLVGSLQHWMFEHVFRYTCSWMPWTDLSFVLHIIHRIVSHLNSRIDSTITIAIRLLVDMDVIVKSRCIVEQGSLSVVAHHGTVK